ncbi:hypothetical protein KIPB_014507, partial [Kipferlia bialata]
HVVQLEQHLGIVPLLSSLSMASSNMVVCDALLHLLLVIVEAQPRLLEVICFVGGAPIMIGAIL